ncbi:TonB-dependent receptor [uncultured Pontibacter sp.]|uniref:TonB-dependent receptor n=1 Tax=uncultured Pontibacter sp. TaxID=453356 RepID=UPI00262674E4|nr:TonB-dependent receptor [uncultured Pontibacter sp.]
MKKFYSTLCLFLALVLTVQYSWAQGTTTAAMNGVVKDQSGTELPGATVIVVHQPTNTQYVAPTNSEGRYNIQNMRVGGPYTVTTSYVGYQEQRIENVTLTLGQNYRLDLVLSESATTLGEVTVTAAQDKVINSDRTGAATSVSTEQIEALPTISRSLNDFTRLTPQASTAGAGTSFAGQSNKYNNFSIDGTVNNDVFGLSSSGTNGGQTGVQPISLDAIEAIQVVVAPFDVRQGGFTGGGVNAITRSGSNNTEGSVYYFGNNEKLVGKSNDAARNAYPDYTDYQLGGRLGGALIKNKLFFFANGEVTKRTQPVLFEPGSPTSNFSIDELDRISAVAKRLGYDPGSFGAQSQETNSEKLFARLDWNINNNHQLTLRHSYTYGEDLGLSRNPNTLRFSNNAVFFPSTTNSTVAQLNSNIGGVFANELLVGYTTVRDNRTISGDPFPTVQLNLSGGRRVTLGGEAFSVANQLDQDVFTLTNNFSWFKGKHTFTFGTHNEFYKTYNLFIRQEFGAYQYDSIEAWEAVGTPEETAPFQYDRTYSLTDNRKQGADFTAFQLGFYAQDEYALMPNLKVTGGIRLDMPTFNDEPAANEMINNNSKFTERGLATNKTPGTQFLISPRVGVNWDVFDDGSTQVRGGAGIFTGRAPFVWISNQYTNTGNMLGSINARGSKYPDLRFNADPNSQITSGDLGLNERASEINITDPNFKFPQLFRVNGAIDRRLPGNVVATVEGIYSKTINNIYYQNLNLVQNGTLEGADKRPIFKRDDTNFNDIIYLTNTNQGYSYSVTGQLQKTFDSGLFGSVAYTYSRAQDANPGNSSQARSNWINVNQVYGLNDIRAAWADNDIRSRIISALGYTLKYENGSSTTISAFYNGQSGAPISYIYNGDINGDDGRTNDLVYIPSNRNEIRFSGDQAAQDAQWEAFNAYVESNEYLRSRRGQYAERNGDRMPWTNQVDLRFMHEIKLNTTDEKSHKLQFTFDVMNAGNLLNKDWGRQYGANFNAFQLLDVVSGSGTTTPTLRYTGRGLTDGNPYFTQDFASRWRGQVGVRYIFK